MIKRGFWRNYGLGFGLDENHGHLADTQWEVANPSETATRGLTNRKIPSPALNAWKHLTGFDSDADKAPQTVTHLNANADKFTNELNAQGYLARRVRQDTDRVPRPLDFRLAIPAGALWVSLLVAQWCGALGLVPSSWIAGVALGISLVAAGVTRTRNRKHRLYPRGNNRRHPGTGTERDKSENPKGASAGYYRVDLGKHRLYPLGSAAALTALAAFAVGLGFAGHAANLAIAASDPLAAIGADPSHRFEIQAQVITSPRPMTFGHSAEKTPQPDRRFEASATATNVTINPTNPNHNPTNPNLNPTSPPANSTTPTATNPKSSNTNQSYRVTLQAKFLTWRGSTYRTRAKLQVKGKGWADIPLGATVSLRTGLARLDPSGEFLGLAKAPGTPRIIAPPSGRFVFVNAVRSRLAEAGTHLAPETRAMIGAMSLGLTQNQSQSDRDAMQIAGLSHLTAVSGLHLSVLLGLALGLTARAPRAIQVAAAGAMMIVFLGMLEGSASVTRAAAMGSVTLLGLALARLAKSIAALSLAVMAMLLVNPWQAASWGFALSVVATFSIVTLGQALSRWLATFLPRFLALPLAISLSAQLGCQPLMLIFRGKLQLFSLPANLLTGAVSSIVTVGGLVLVALATITHLGITLAQFATFLEPASALIFAPFSPLTEVTAQVTGLAANWILGVARFFSQLQGAEIPWIESGYGIFGILVVTLAFLWLSGRYAYLRHWSVSLGSPFRFHEVPF
ncbi:ComEC/Rec2 family competence protein [Mobiluncus mulieris]|uniref:ComEC/Rec2 family competence protein n=1 Tax=Mobiluncus mulieris TaxID=2052 RepID=UPI0021E2B097|nr:ComEC/Rec2 family competence protein [Mobiluncus mulieris]MCU9993017.1 ComEC/Rec2 family competence protein [Mobiluncus mulieris]